MIERVQVITKKSLVSSACRTVLFDPLEIVKYDTSLPEVQARTEQAGIPTFKEKSA